jgi:hypothetical protein
LGREPHKQKLQIERTRNLPLANEAHAEKHKSDHGGQQQNRDTIDYEKCVGGHLK